MSGAPYNTTSLLNSNVPALSTFQSHNQRAVYVPGAGIFVAYLTSESGTYGTSTDRGRARVVFSSDNGAHWKILLKIGIHGHSPPSLEADSARNVYAFLGETPGTYGALMFKFPAGRYASYRRYTIGGGEANTDKWTSAYDRAVSHLYYLKGDGSTGSFRLYTIDASTDQVSQNLSLLKTTRTTYPHYPLLYVANDGSQLTLLAWTNTLFSNNGYYDIHYLVSTDHGRSWLGRNGTIPTAAYPIDPTNGGPSFALMDPSEYTARTNRWLANVYVQDRKLLFVFSDRLGHLWYRRVDWATRARDVFDSAGQVCGSTICLQNNAAFFSGNGTSRSRIFLTGGSNGNVGTLYSDDSGATWHDYAVTLGRNGTQSYGISGSRRLGPNGEIFGAFTDESDRWYSGNAAEFVHTAWKLRRQI